MGLDRSTPRRVTDESCLRTDVPSNAPVRDLDLARLSHNGNADVRVGAPVRHSSAATIDRMETPGPRHATIVAVTTADETHAAVRKRAAAIASSAGSTVILWAADSAPSPLEAPLPTQWSGDGEAQQFGDRLSPDDLVAAGQEPLARQLDDLRGRGIDAWAWLPPKADAEHLAEYAAYQCASHVLVSTDDADLIADLRDVEQHERDQPAGGHRVRVAAVPG